MGLQTTISQAVDVLATGGRAVVVGLGPDPVLGPPPTVFVRKEASIISSYASSRTTVERLVALAASGALDLARSITHVFPLDQADEALRVLHSKDGHPLRVVVRPGLKGPPAAEVTRPSHLTRPLGAWVSDNPLGVLR